MTRAFANVTIVTVTYESAALVNALTATLDRFDHVIVIDNASHDHTAAELSKRLPHARVIRNDVNLGFGPANNRAIAMVTTPYALMLNPDCDISTDALQRLIDTAERYSTAALVAPQGWYAKDKPQPSYRQAFHEHRAARPYQIPDGTCSAKWLHGCCLLVRVSAFRDFGGFDERFFLYYEDDDLCLRALQAGYDCVLEPTAQVMHTGGGSSAPSWRTDFRKHYYFFRSRHLILGKYLGASTAMRYRLKTAIVAPLATLLYAIFLQRKHALKWLAWGCSAWTMPTP